MTEHQEGLIGIAVYVFFATCIALPFIVARLYYKINKTINRADKILGYVEENEIEARKYRD